MTKTVDKFEDYGIIIPGNKLHEKEIFLTCPICSHTRKPENQKKLVLGVNVEEGFWGCKHCGWAGHLLTEDYVKDKKFLPLDNTRKITNLPEKIITFFANRGISKGTLMKMKIGYDEFDNDKWIVFIYFEGFLPVMYKFRNGFKDFRIRKSDKLILYNIDSITKTTDSAIITEGEIDCLSFVEINLYETVSVPNGTTLSAKEKEHFLQTGEFFQETHLNLVYLDSHINKFDNVKTIYLATDSDAPGMKLREELGRRFGRYRCKIIYFDIFYNEKEKRPCKDANEVLVLHGKEALKECYHKAKPFPMREIKTITDVFEKIQHQYNNGRKKGVSTGFECLDPHFTWRRGHLVILNGYPGMGKTTFMRQLILLTAIKYDWKWGIYSPENYPIEDLYIDFIEIYSGKSIDNKRTTRITQNELEAAKDFINEHIFVVEDNEDGYTADQFRKITQRLIKEKGIIGIVKDPWNALLEERVRGDDFNSYMKRETHKEQIFTIKEDIINLICIHPPTPDHKSTLEHPKATQAEGGAWWFKRAYEFMCIHKENESEMDNTISNIYVQKTKHHDLIGIPTYGGAVQIKFKRLNKRFLETNGNDPINIAKSKTEQLTLNSF